MDQLSPTEDMDAANFNIKVLTNVFSIEAVVV
jgi:hypothetical protein